MKHMKGDAKMENKATAAEWFVRLRSDQAPVDTDAAFLAWLRQSPEHEADYSLCEFTELLVRELHDDSELQPQLEECRKLARQYRSPIGKRMVAALQNALPRRWVLAASVTFMAALGIAGVLRLGDPAYETAIGEQRTVALPDGSQMALNTDTSLSVDYTSERRRIRLRRGEAFFTVAKDAARPFEVMAGGGVARAVGTAFGVAIREDEVKVSVLEGTVEVNVPVESPGPAAGVEKVMTLTQGNVVKYWSHGAIAQVEEADTRRINAWREGKVAFDGMRLIDVVNEHNRYTAQRIVLGSDDIKNLAVSGMFAIGDTESLLFLLEHSLGLKAIRQSNVIVLTRPSISRPAEAGEEGSQHRARPADKYAVPDPAKT